MPKRNVWVSFGRGCRASIAPSGVAQWNWSVVERPRGSASLLGDGPQPSLLLDTAGHYAFALTVVDGEGRVSCNAARVTATAWANHGIEVQLDWDTPGMDMDLHLLHPDGRWDASPYDCYWLNRNPNWGRLDDTSDDPALWIDSVDGGPERATLAIPEVVTYRVGANYFSDHGRGATRVRARIWLDGVLAYDQTAQLSDRTFWEIARVTWGQEPYVDEVNQVFNGFP